MCRYRFSPGKILVHRNIKELPVEINISMHMLVLSNLLLLVHACLNSGNFIVARLSCVGVTVKI